MKKISKILPFIIALLFIFAACNNNYIDGITHVDPGTDETAPVVTINRPFEGLSIKVPDVVASIEIKFEVTDDIEIATVVVLLDGLEIASFSDFIDYRKFIMEDLVYNNVTTGSHILTVKATDLDGKTTENSVNFVKEPPYLPKYDGEIFYMPFDGDYTELVSVTPATEVGSPGFTNDAVIGASAYMGATDSYLTFPTDGLLTTNEFSAAFWYKVNANPDRAGLLIIGDNADDRKHGLRFFREGSADEQKFKLNIGIGDGDSWNKGGVINVSDNKWVFITISISETESKVYFDGILQNTSTLNKPVDWTGCDFITIGSGGETFNYWNHNSDASPMDELRLFNKALTAADISLLMNEANESLYMPFNGNFKNLVNGTEADVIGSPGFTTGKDGQAYAGAIDSYLTLPTEGLLSDEISATMWYKVNNDPDRAGILVIGPKDENKPDAMNNRKNGFRLFRENGDDGKQRIKLNVGRGDNDTWVDGKAAADIDPTSNEWVFLAFSIASDKASLYFNGELIKESSLDGGIDWTGCDILSIMSGAPRFIGWNHLSDLSLIDELKLYNKALTQEEIQQLMGN
ncbi:MAG: hypothetical protein CR989_03615 [Flavobacteriales bacterium]|nr:MAG: hypothetical protein CR989_03615 [Flavobacteriales bacterium]